MEVPGFTCLSPFARCVRVPQIQDGALDKQHVIHLVETKGNNMLDLDVSQW